MFISIQVSSSFILILNTFNKQITSYPKNLGLGSENSDLFDQTLSAWKKM